MNKVFEYIKNNKIETVSVLLIFILGLWLRITALVNLGDFWLDELYTTYYATLDSGYKTISELFKFDFHMPLHFLLLHYWIKVFGTSESAIRSMTLVLTAPIISFVFYTTKKLFNKKTAYFASILLAINTFAIYYSVENRLYGLSMILAYLFTIYFIKVINTDLDKKYLNTFLIIAFLFFMTHNISFIYAFFCFLAGLAYIFFNKTKELKRYFKISTIVFLLALPAVIFDISNYLTIQSNLTNYAKEFFKFSWLCIYDIFENFFTNSNEQLTNGTFQTYHNMFLQLNNFEYFLFVFIPIAVSLAALIRAFISKNKNALFLLVPAVLFMAFYLFCSSHGYIAYQTKYMIIILPNIICALAFGLTCFKSKYTGNALFLLIVFLNSFYLIEGPANILNRAYYEQGNIGKIAKTIDFKDGDYVIAPVASHIFKYYFPKNIQMIDFSLDSGLLMKDEDSLKFYFGNNYKSKYKKTTIRDVLIDDLINDVPIKTFEDNLMNNYISKMKKGNKLVFLAAYSNIFGNLEQSSYIQYFNFRDVSLFDMIMTKGVRDTKIILDKHLKLIKSYPTNGQDFKFYVYEK